MESEKKLPDLFLDIVYIIPVEDGDPSKASLFEGFSPSLLRNTGIVRLINQLPSDLYELTQEGQKLILPRRISGQTPIRWYAQSPKALSAGPLPSFSPFTVFFLGESHRIETYKPWIDSHEFPLTVVATSGGTITYEEFSIETLKDSFLRICESLRGKVDAESLESAIRLLKEWKAPKLKDLGYNIGGHNCTAPNVDALRVLGFENPVDQPLPISNDGLRPHLEQIIQTTQSILEERRKIGTRKAHRYFRTPPSLNVFSPAMYPLHKDVDFFKLKLPHDQKKQLEHALRALIRQKGYYHIAEGTDQIRILLGDPKDKNPRPHALFQVRSQELAFVTACMGTVAASEVSAVLRLPNAVNTTIGLVKQFSEQYHAKGTTDKKQIKLFQKLQDSITQSVPTELHQFFETAEDGIRLVCDAHLEWLNIRGLPLCIQKDISRIPVTPGNLFVDLVSAKPYIHLQVSHFEEILLISALKDDDKISGYIELGLEGFKDSIAGRAKVRAVKVANKEELISALNSFDGAMLIFDGHGEHKIGEAATLYLQDEKIDVWELDAKQIRVPPIVILSACDTHAAARNHASTGNGFLSIGARCVLATVFPIDARLAAMFVARLIYRIVEFIPAAQRMYGKSLTWMEVISGLIRMQLLTEFLMRLLQKGIIDMRVYRVVHENGNGYINGGSEWPFEEILGLLANQEVDINQARVEIVATVATSSTISYIHLGRPETVIVHPNEPFDEDGVATDDAES